MIFHSKRRGCTVFQLWVRIEGGAWVMDDFYESMHKALKAVERQKPTDYRIVHVTVTSPVDKPDSGQFAAVKQAQSGN